MIRPRLPVHRESAASDGVAGLVLGVESVPDGLALGLMAGVNPVYGLYAYLVGTFTGALATSSSFMAVQATGAMAIIIADVDAIRDASDPARALFTLSFMTGVLMIVAGVLRLGSVLRFVSNAVMVGFVNAVGVNIMLGQLGNFTGYEGQGPNRVARAIDTLLHPGRLDGRSVAVGITTVALIVILERTPLGPLGLVVAIVATSAAVVALGWHGVAQLADLAEVPRSLPGPVLPDISLVVPLAVPAISLAFVGLVQGAAISANFPNPDGTYPDVSRDFIGQGAANVACGVFQGMPVGGSMSASSLIKSAGAKTRQALVFAAVVMAVVILLFSSAVSKIALPALAGLIMLVGYRTIKPDDVRSVAKTGPVQAAVLTATFVLTLVIPLQYAVVVGVALSVILHVISQSNQVEVKWRVYGDDGSVREADPPPVVPPDTVLVLQPYGSLFFASASSFEAALPAVEADVAPRGGHPAPPRPDRPRRNLHGRCTQIRTVVAGCRQQAGHRLRQRTSHRSARRHAGPRRRPQREHLRRRRMGGPNRAARPRRRAQVDRGGRPRVTRRSQSSEVSDDRHRSAVDAERVPAMIVGAEENVDYAQQLRLLTLNDASLVEDHPGVLGTGPSLLDAKSLALVRLAALVGVGGGAVPSYSALVDAAVGVGATVAEIVAVLVEVIPVVGLPRAVAEAPKLALAVGYDTDEAFEGRCDRDHH